MADDKNNGHPHYLTFDDIEAAQDLPEKDVYIDLWEGLVRIKALPRETVTDAYNRAKDKRTGETDPIEAERLLVLWSMVSPKITPEQYKVLQKKNAGAIGQITDAIMALSGLDREAMKRAAATFRD